MEVHRHVMVLFRPFLQALGTVVAASLVGAFMDGNGGGGALDALLGAAAAFFVLRLLWRCLEWQADRLVVTDQRIFEVSGILTRKVASTPLAKLTDMTYRRSLWGRLFGYGDIIVETAGQNQALSKIAYLPAPDSFYRRVTSLVAARVSTPHVPASPRPVGPDEEDTGPMDPVIL